MAVPTISLRNSVRQQVSEAEWAKRVDLAACYRFIDLYGMSEMSANHVSTRVPGEGNAFLINPHGLLTVGASIAEAFNSMFRLERACQVQVAALSCNVKLKLPAPEVVDESWRLYQPGVRRRFGVLEWPALLKKLDKIDPSYRE